MANLYFKEGQRASFDALASKDPHTFYWCNDSKELFLGEEKINFDESQISNYLPLSGGTMTGNIDFGKVGNITNLPVNGGIFWNPYVESDTDGTDAASIVVIKDGNNTNGTVLEIRQRNDPEDIVNIGTYNNYGFRVNGNVVLNTAQFGEYALPLTGGSLGGDLWIQKSTPAVSLLGNNSSSYSILYLNGNHPSGGGVIFQNGPDRQEDGGPNLLTIRNDVGDIRLDDNVNITHRLFCNNGIIVEQEQLGMTNGLITQIIDADKRSFWGANGIAFSNPGVWSDQGWIRVLGTSEADMVMEIATGDDGTGQEQIVVRQYDTSSNVVREAKLFDQSGNTQFPGQTIVGGLHTTDWIRSYGNTGWYSQEYGGGWWMTDYDWIRSFGDKSLFMGNGKVRSDRVEGGMWITGTHDAAFEVKAATQASAGAYYQGWFSGKTPNGAWSMGCLAGYDDLYFAYGTDANYNTGTNAANNIRFSPDGAVYGAVWNDYAEFRQLREDTPIPYGRIVIENGDDTLSLSSKRLELGGNVVSDTFGFAIGETDEAKLPIAVAGRALVYTWEDRELFQPGMAVCSGPEGTVSLMSRSEIKEWPDAIIGYVSAVPDYETWGQNNVAVDGRIWIKVK